MKTLSMLSIISLFLITSPIFADRYIPSHLCFKPEKPLFMASPYQHQQYNNDVTTFKFCIREFVKNQERAIIIHQEAIKKSTSDWNEFIQEEEQ